MKIFLPIQFKQNNFSTPSLTRECVCVCEKVNSRAGGRNQTLNSGERKFYLTLRCTFWNHKRERWNRKFDKKQTWEREDSTFSVQRKRLLIAFMHHYLFSANENFWIFTLFAVKKFALIFGKFYRDFFICLIYKFSRISFSAIIKRNENIFSFTF